MENVGAVKELSKITSHLEARICELEQKNKHYSSSKNNNPGIALSDLSSECILFTAIELIFHTRYTREPADNIRVRGLCSPVKLKKKKKCTQHPNNHPYNFLKAIRKIKADVSAVCFNLIITYRICTAINA